MESEVRRISTADAVALIQRHGLSTIGDSWHYSYDIERFYGEMFLYERGAHVYVYHDTPIHQWAPSPVFSNDRSLSRAFAEKDKVGKFWFLRLNTFDSFLARRSLLSATRSSNFPSIQTYRKYKRKANCHIEQFNLSDELALFTSAYDRLKAPKYHHSGNQCVEGALASNVDAPRSWFKFYMLRENGSGDPKGVALVIDDGRSCSLINIASVIGRQGYGLYMHVAMIEDLCRRGYLSLDGGVSGAYGHYKDKIFLDALAIDNTGKVDFQA